MAQSDKEKRLVRSGYYHEKKHYLDNETFNKLSDDDYQYYYDEGKRVRLRNILQGMSVYIVIALIIGGVVLYAKLNHKNPAPTGTSSNTSQASDSSSNTSSNEGNSGLDANGCYTPDTVRQHENTNGCVDFNVGYAYKDNAGTVFIDQLSDYTEGVEVYIAWNAPASDIDYQALEGKNIKASGYISNYNGAPQVTVTQLSQIQIYQQ